MTAPRIVHVIHSSDFGGGPNMVDILCDRLHQDFEMRVITDGMGDLPARLRRHDVPMTQLPLTTKWSFSANIPRLASELRSRRPDLVHLHGQFAGSLGQIAVQLAGRPRSLYTVQWPAYLDDSGPWSRLRNYSAERISCGQAAAVVAVSEHDRQELISRRLCDRQKLTVIHNAYHLEDLDGAATGRADRPPVVGFIGRLVEQKGGEYLIRAAQQVVSAHPSARFVVVGDGPERPRLEGLTQELGLGAAVEFVGYDPQPARRLMNMSVLAVPSIFEPLGMVALEAMACGLPVVASEVGGLPEAVENNSTGLLVPPRDSVALATALDHILSAPGEAAEMGRAGRERALRLFSPEVIAKRYAELYRRLLNTSS